MAVADDVTKGVGDVLDTAWSIRDGYVVPETDNVTLRNGAVKLNATYLYADMAGSSELAQSVDAEVTAKVIRTYLNAATRILRHYGGQIRSFDGDRVMAIFVGTDQATKAVRAALAIDWAVTKVINPKLEKKWPSTLSSWSMGHGIGIDTGEALIVRGGVRDNNDLISIGRAPNVAAKLSDLREKPDIYITDDVYTEMSASVTWAADSRNMWDWNYYRTIGGELIDVYGSTFFWQPS